MPRRARLVLVVAALGLASVACSSSDGRSLPPPGPHQTTTSVSTPVVGQPSSEGDSILEVFSLSSPAFAPGAALPARHTCDGEGVSPALTWASMPPAAELALVVRDRDVPFVHWVVTGIDPSVRGFGEGGVPEAAVEALNSTGEPGWTPPCPPAGGPPHTYDFVLHALPEPLALQAGMPADEAAGLVEGASSARAVLSATVSR